MRHSASHTASSQTTILASEEPRTQSRVLCLTVQVMPKPEGIVKAMKNERPNLRGISPQEQVYSVLGYDLHGFQDIS